MEKQEFEKMKNYFCKINFNSKMIIMLGQTKDRKRGYLLYEEKYDEQIEFCVLLHPLMKNTLFLKMNSCRKQRKISFQFANKEKFNQGT